MRIVEKSAARFFAGALLMTVAGGAAAQQPTPRRPAPLEQTVQAPVQGGAPQRTTATYEDWVVQCQTQAGPPLEKVCDMAQATQMQGKNLPFSRVAIAHPAKGQPVKLFVQVPINVSFATNVRIQTGDSDPGLAAPFARCVPSGCFADFDIKDDALKRFRTASGAGKLSFADAGGHDVAVPLSFKGFSQAFDALSKE
jgi:invasion protein IalB